MTKSRLSLRGIQKETVDDLKWLAEAANCSIHELVEIAVFDLGQRLRRSFEQDDWECNAEDMIYCLDFKLLEEHLRVFNHGNYTPLSILLETATTRRKDKEKVA